MWVMIIFLILLLGVVGFGFIGHMVALPTVPEQPPEPQPLRAKASGTIKEQGKTIFQQIAEMDVSTRGSCVSSGAIQSQVPTDASKIDTTLVIAVTSSTFDRVCEFNW